MAGGCGDDGVAEGAGATASHTGGGGGRSGGGAGGDGGGAGGHPGRVRRWGWLVLGWAAVALGTVGVVVPGWPTTVFFIAAASCFARSSPRFERWVLGLPKVGPLVRDHRAGLGMPRRAKVVAMAMIVVAVTASVVLAISAPAWRAGVVALGLVGVAYIGLRVPTREAVVAGARASE